MALPSGASVMGMRLEPLVGGAGGRFLAGLAALAALAGLVVTAVCVALVAPSALHAQDPAGGGLAGQELPSVEELMDYLDDLYRSSSSHAVMTMTVQRERGTRTLTLESWSLGDDEALIVIREPAREAGTATLRTEEGLWNYAPRADRLIRIPTGLLSDAWMGSHFTNDDLVRETSYREDYETTLSVAERDGEPYILATLVPRPDAPVVYTRIEYLVEPESWIPMRADYYDEGELVRTMRFDRIEAVNGRRIPMRMTLQPADDPDERTEVLYQELDFDIDLAEDLFTRRGLRRVARSGR